VLAALALIWVPLDAHRPRHQEGRTAGRAVARALPDGAVVWANDLIEARPDVLLYARRAAHDESRSLVPQWKKEQLLAGKAPPEGVYLLLRDDPESDEFARYAMHLPPGSLNELARGTISKYHWVLVQVAPAAP
jgi:hypothetical protein